MSVGAILERPVANESKRSLRIVKSQIPSKRVNKKRIFDEQFPVALDATVSIYYNRDTTRHDGERDRSGVINERLAGMAALLNLIDFTQIERLLNSTRMNRRDIREYSMTVLALERSKHVEDLEKYLN